MEALIFDFDGTIIESEGPDFQTWQEIFADHGAELPLAQWIGYIGTAAGTFDPYRLLAELSGRHVDKEAIRAVRRQRFRQLVSQQPLRPGVAALLDAAASSGLPMAIASSSTRDWVDWNLEQRDLRRHFRFVHTVNDVKQGKPDPELYLMTVAALGVRAAATVAIEDSYNGMIAAKRAGLTCIVAPNVLTQGIDFTEADLVVASLESITLDHLYRLVGSRS